MTPKYNLNLKENKDFIVKRNHWLPRKLGVQYFAFGDTLYCANAELRIPTHEYLHVAQYKRYRIPMVFLHYLFNFIKNYIKYRHPGTAFTQIPFEIEARNFEKEKGQYLT